MERKNSIDVAVGKSIRKARSAIEMSEEDFAKRLEITVEHLKEMESGSRRAGAERLIEAAKILDITMGDLYTSLYPNGFPEKSQVPSPPENDRAAALIRSVRQEKGMSLEEVACELGIGVEKLLQYEAGVTRISLDMIAAFRAVLGDEMMQLFTEVDDEITPAESDEKLY